MCLNDRLINPVKRAKINNAINYLILITVKML